MRKIGIVIIFLMMASTVLAAGDYETFDQLLSDHVAGGVVDYGALCKDTRLNDVTARLSKVDTQQLGSVHKQLVFWINAYNAFTLRDVCAKYPIDSMNDLNFGGLLVAVALKKTVWDKKDIVINGNTYSLKQIEHDIIHPQFNEPRAHFAIACGAVSCPPLASSAYEGDLLEEQLNEQSKAFLNNKRYNLFNKENKTASLSSILNWNARYFGKDKNEVLLFISQFLPDDIKKSIQNDPAGWKISYNSYDLTLNDK